MYHSKIIFKIDLSRKKPQGIKMYKFVKRNVEFYLQQKAPTKSHQSKWLYMTICRKHKPSKRLLSMTNCKTTKTARFNSIQVNLNTAMLAVRSLMKQISVINN